MKTHAAGNPLKSEVAIIFKIIYALAYFLYSIFIDKGIEILAKLLVDDLREIAIVDTKQRGQTLGREVGGAKMLGLFEHIAYLTSQLLLGVFIERTSLILLPIFTLAL